MLYSGCSKLVYYFLARGNTMWNRSKSLRLTIVCTWLFMALLLAAVVFAPQIAYWYFSGRENSQFYCQLFCIVVYVSAAPSAVLLLYLNRLLSRIHKGEFFSEANIFSLSLISWCSFCVAIVTLLAGLFYLSFLLVAVAFAFIGLIVRVVKNVFEQALAIKEENDLTV